MSADCLGVKDIRAWEEKARKIGLDERILIENASSNLSCILKRLDLGKHAVVVAGRGNNGADVLAAARKLLASSYKVKIIIVAEKKLNKESLFQYRILCKLTKNIYIVRNKEGLPQLKRLLQKGDFVLEGVLGIGLKGEVRGFLREVIRTINIYAKRIVSCDIPSGLHPETGEVMGEAIKADYTITFIALKKGFLSKEGKKHCGKVYVTDIGI